jgi:hypothetical protein
MTQTTPPTASRAITLSLNPGCVSSCALMRRTMSTNAPAQTTITMGSTQRSTRHGPNSSVGGTASACRASSV